jgi:hypothetical protein
MSDLNIEPIRLLRGSHEDTGYTGHGCIMNVCSYLNGDTHITDQPKCVDPAVVPLAIITNDVLTDEDRQNLMRFIPAAMESGENASAMRVTRFEALCALQDELQGIARAIEPAKKMWRGNAVEAEGIHRNADAYKMWRELAAKVRNQMVLGDVTEMNLLSYASRLSSAMLSLNKVATDLRAVWAYQQIAAALMSCLVGMLPDAELCQPAYEALQRLKQTAATGNPFQANSPCVIPV